MSKDFEQIGHKNLELFRFYVSKDIKRIDKKMEENESNILGYFLGSLIDLLIVIFFDQGVNELLKSKCSVTQIACKVVGIVGLLFLFLFISWSTKKIHLYFLYRNKESGRSEYVMKEEQQITIDEFDNIACDGLLICENYIKRYNETVEQHVRNFYLYEIIHHMDKAGAIFNDIYCHRTLYISSENDELLDSYRVNNFIIFAQNKGDMSWITS